MSLRGYRPDELVGETARRRLLRGRRTRDGLPVLLVLPAAPLAGARPALERELRLLGALPAEPGLPRPLGLAEGEDHGALVLADLPGHPLDRHPRPLPLPELLPLAVALARLVARLHHLGVRHLAIHPASILLDPSQGTVALLDFGAATLLPRLPRPAGGPDWQAADPTYLAPEQTGRVNRWVDHRTDLYALGAVLYELLAGRPPFAGGSPGEVAHRHVAHVPRPLHELVGVPPVVSAIVDRLLAKAAEDRYPSADALALDLEECRARLDAGGRIAPFPLARRRPVDRLTAPDRLIGRVAELHALEEAFAASREQAGLVLLEGGAGVGKTRLAEALRPLVERCRGAFVAADFAPGPTDAPHAAVVSALGDLLAGAPAAGDAVWQRRVVGALGAGAAVLAEVLPGLATFAGVPAAPSPGAADERPARLSLAVARLLGALAAEGPVVLFLDDLHLAEEGALEPLADTLAAAAPPGVLVLCAGRSVASAASRRVGAWIERLGREAPDRVTRIQLAPLDAAATGALVAEILGERPELVRDLAEVVHRRTGGNPLHARELLTALHARRILRYLPQQGRWWWDAAELAGATATHDVVELVHSRLLALDADVRGLLQVAACLGMKFAVETLAAVTGHGPQAVLTLLWPATRAEVLVLEEAPEGQRRCRFLHDEVRRAAWGLLEEADRAATHLEIARALRRGVAGAVTRAELARHYNAGLPAVTDGAERVAVARLDLEAAREAEAAGACSGARAYAEAGLAALGDDAWESHPDLAATLAVARFEALTGEGGPAEAEAAAAALVPRAPAGVPRARVLAALARLRGLQGRYGAALQAGEAALSEIGQPAVERPREPVADALPDAAHLRPTTDPAAVVAAEALAALLFAAWLGGRWPAAARRGAEATHLTLAAGFTRQAFVGPLCLAAARRLEGAADSAEPLTTWAHALAERAGPRAAALASALDLALQCPWREAPRSAAAAAAEAWRGAVDLGPPAVSVLAALHRGLHGWWSGQPLDGLVQRLEIDRHHLLRAGHGPGVALLDGLRDAARALLEGGPDEAMPPVADADFGGARLVYHVTRAELAWRRGRAGDALTHARAARTEAAGHDASFATVLLDGFEALAHVAALDGGAPPAAHLPAVQALHRRLADRAARSPVQLAALARLVEAERTRAEGGDPEPLYHAAAEAAAEAGLVQHEAVCHELLARLWLRRRRPHYAAHHVREGAARLRRWGAEALARRLEATVHDLPAAPAWQREGRLDYLLDLGAVLATSRAIAGAVRLDEVVQRVMDAMLELSGADRGLLLLDHDGGLRVEAESTAGGGTRRYSDPVPAERAADRLPLSLVQQVAAAGEAVTVDDAATSARGADDEYLRGGVRSIHCLPVRAAARCIGVVYLESSRAAAAFTRTRREVLRLLAGQAAASLESARLNEVLRENERRYRDLFEHTPAAVAEIDLSAARAWLLTTAGGAAPADYLRDHPDVAEGCLRRLRIVAVNRATLELFRVTSPAELAATFPRLIAPGGRGDARGGFGALLAGRTLVELETEVRTFDGAVRYLLVRGSVPPGHEALLDRVLVSLLDLTERKSAEEERQRLLRRLQLKNEELNDVVYVASHDLRAPLVNIQGFGGELALALEVLEERLDAHGLPGDAQREVRRLLDLDLRSALNYIRSSARQMDQVLAGLLRLSRVGRAALLPARLDMNHLLQQVLDAMEFQVRRSGALVTIDVLPPCRADASQIQQVFRNLLDNAINYLDPRRPGRIQVSGRVRGTQVVYTVEDNGVGIPAALQDKVFEIFHRLDPKGPVPGEGLGLTIVRRILDRHDGDISLESAPGRGTRFHVRLPAG